MSSRSELPSLNALVVGAPEQANRVAGLLADRPGIAEVQVISDLEDAHRHLASAGSDLVLVDLFWGDASSTIEWTDAAAKAFPASFCVYAPFELLRDKPGLSPEQRERLSGFAQIASDDDEAFADLVDHLTGVKKPDDGSGPRPDSHLEGSSQARPPTPEELAATAPGRGGNGAPREISDEIREWQRGLHTLGLFAGPVDGMEGPLTSGAIRRFQEEERLEPTGAPTPEGWDALERRLRDEAPHPPPSLEKGGGSRPPERVYVPGLVGEPAPDRYPEMDDSVGDAIGYAAALAGGDHAPDSVQLLAGVLLSAPGDSRESAAAAVAENIAVELGVSPELGPRALVHRILGSDDTSPLPDRPARLPSRVDGELREVLAMAGSVAARTGGGHAPLRVVHLLAALVSSSMALRVHRRLAESGAGTGRWRLALQAYVQQNPRAGPVEEWGRILRSPETPRFAHVEHPSAFHSDHLAGSPFHERDRLGITPEVNALAAVLAARAVDPPLSIGLFGDWGTGKSFFMQQMEERIDHLAARGADPESPYCGDVVQIRFNAWHYMDANLWANLVSRVFEGLAEYVTRSGQSPAAARTLFSEIAESRGLLAEARAERSAAEADRERAARRLRATRRWRARVERRVGSASEGVAHAIRRQVLETGEIRSRLSEAARELGVSEAQLGEVEERIRELESLWGRIRAMRGALSGRRLRTLAIILCLAAVPVLSWVLLDHLTDMDGASRWMATAAALATTASTALAPWLRRASTALQHLQEAHGSLNEGERRAAEKHAAELSRALERVEAAERAALAAERDARERVRRADRELDELRTGRTLLRFIEERHAGDQYRQHLGVVNLIRNDFERLSELLRRSRGSAREVDLPRVERIILYIDDLDRCPEQRVVEVLQAVHLLLAFPLFVVVVGVDSRWLLRAVHRHHSAMLTGGAEGNRAEEDHWAPTPQNYLEKIFQIPFALRPLDPHGFGDLVSSLIQPRSSDDASPAPAPPSSADTNRLQNAGLSARDVRADPNRAGSARGSESGGLAIGGEGPFRTPEASVAAPEGLRIETWELEFLRKLAPLISSPRSAKRFVNVYRFVRGCLGPEALVRFRGTSELPGEHQVAALLLAAVTGFPAEADDLLRRIHDAGPGGSWTGVVKAYTAASAGRDTPSSTLADALSLVLPALTIGDELEPFLRWSPHVARFSFQTARSSGDRLEAEARTPA